MTHSRKRAPGRQEIKLKPNAIIDKKTGQIIVQTRMPFFNIIAFEGGGKACMAYVSAIKKMNDYGVTDDLEYVSGVSGGGLAALSVCLGCSNEFTSELLGKIPTAEVMEGTDSFTFLGKLYKLYTEGGLSSGNVLIKFVEDIMEKTLGNRQATLLDLHNRILEDKEKNHGVTRFKDLFIGTTDTASDFAESLVFSWQSPADMQYPIPLLVFATACYPGLFKPVVLGENSEHRLIDGGAKSNVQTKIFDNRDYFLEGDDFSHTGRNKRVLVIKVDSYAEKNHILWNIKKKAKILSFWDKCRSVGNAITENADFNEFRFERSTLILTDADIVDRFDMKGDPEKEARLCNEAEATTKDFLESLVNVLEKMEYYSNFREWLDAQPIAHVKAVRNKYTKMLTKLRASPQEAADREKLAEFDPDRPTIAQLECQRNFFNDYIDVWGKDGDFEKLKFPEHHINIPLKPIKRYHLVPVYPEDNGVREKWKIYVEMSHDEGMLPEDGLHYQVIAPDDTLVKHTIPWNELPDDFPRNSHALMEYKEKYLRPLLYYTSRAGHTKKINNYWRAILNDEMEKRLVTLNSKIKSLEDDYQVLMQDLVHSLDKELPPGVEPFHGYSDEKIQTLTSYYELLCKYREERRSYQNKLGKEIPDQEPYDSKEHMRFFQKLQAIHDIATSSTMSNGLRTVLNVFAPNSYYPVIEFSAEKSFKNKIDFRLDMSKQLDRKLYLIGAMQYLNRRGSWDRKHFAELYQLFFPGEVVMSNAPQDLEKLIGLSGPELYVAMFRLECLIQHFEIFAKSKAKFTPPLQLNAIFKLTDFSMFGPKQLPEKQTAAAVPAAGNPVAARVQGV